MGKNRRSHHSQKVKPAEPRPVRSRRERWVRRAIWWVVLPVTLYTLFGFFAVPLLIRHVGVPQLNKRINGLASLKRAAYNPFKLHLRLEDFEILNDQGVRIAGFRSFDGGFLAWDTLVNSGWHFDAAIVESPEVRADVDPQGRLNFSKLIEPMLPPPGTPLPGSGLKRIPRIVVQRMGVARANFVFTDRTLATPFHTEYLDLTFELDDLDTRPDVQNVHTLTATSTSQESALWEGFFYANPLTSKGTFTIRNLDLAGFMPYAESRTEGKLTSGKLTAEIEYDFAPVGTPRIVSARIVKGQLADVVVELAGKPILRAATGVIEDCGIDGVSRDLTIGKLSLDKASLVAERDAAGVVSLTRLAPTFDIDVFLDQFRLAGASVDPSTIENPIEQVAVAIRQLANDAIGPWNLVLEQLAVTSASLSWNDAHAARQVAYEFYDISVNAGPVRTTENYKIPVKVTAVSRQGGTASIDGLVEPFGRKLTLAVRTDSFNLAPAAGYLPEQLPEPFPPAVLSSALASVDGTFAIDISAPPVGAVTWEGAVKLSGAAMTSPGGGAPVAGLESFDLQGNARAELNDLAPQTLRWEGKVSLTGGRVDAAVAELTRASAAQLEADGRAAIELTSAGANISWDGIARAGGIDAQAAVAGPVSLKVGSLSSTGALKVVVPASANADLSYTGRAEVGSAAIEAPDRMNARIALGSATIEDVRLSTAERAASIKSLTASSPELAVVLPLLPPPSDGKPAKKAAPADKGVEDFVNPLRELVKSLGYNVTIEQLAIASGKLSVTDVAESATPLVAEAIDVQAVNLNTNGQTMAEVTVSSKVQGSGAFKLVGKVDPFREMPAADVEVSVSTVPAKPFDPFVGRYLGYFVDRGRVNSTIPIRVEDGSLSGMLNFSLDQFHLGEATKSTDAPDVPIKLGLDLLRDSNDNVSGKIPLSGKLTDPDFSVTGLVWEAFSGLLFKAATAPFQILGSLFGAAEGQDLSMVEFQAGSVELAPGQLSTIDIIAKAMSERPAITMVAGGRFNAEADTPGMQKLLLRERMLKRVQSGSPYIEKLDERQYNAAIEAAWKEWRREKLKAGTLSESDGGRVSPEQMEKDLLEGVEVPADRFAELARGRAEAVVAILVKDHAISPGRVAVGEGAPDTMASDKPKVEFGVK